VTTLTYSESKVGAAPLSIIKELELTEIVVISPGSILVIARIYFFVTSYSK
jgi:hypothetical protein